VEITKEVEIKGRNDSMTRGRDKRTRYAAIYIDGANGSVVIIIIIIIIIIITIIIIVILIVVVVIITII
jgi:hypothetical protein